MAAITGVRMNGRFYPLADGDASFKQGYVHQTSEPFRTIGVQRRIDNRKVNKFVFNNWAQVGLGCQRLRRDRTLDHGGTEGQHIGGLRDADAETRFLCAAQPAIDHGEVNQNPTVARYEHVVTHLFGKHVPMRPGVVDVLPVLDQRLGHIFVQHGVAPEHHPGQPTRGAGVGVEERSTIEPDIVVL